jgi:hypothetical protein
MSNSRKTPNPIPITEGDGFETEADSGIIRLFVGSQGDALNWRTGQSRPLKEGEVRPFPLTHPNLIVTAEPAAISMPGEPLRNRKSTKEKLATEPIPVPTETRTNSLAMCAAQRDECRDRNPRTGEPNAMQRFSINDENEIQALHAESTLPAGSTEFHSEKELAKVAADWTAARLVEIWNGLTGVTAVRKFKDRATAVSRIWKQIQSLEVPAPEPVRKPRPEAGRKTTAPKTTATPEGTATKKDQVLALLRSANGATLNEIMAATGWQKHSVRGFLSGAVHKKMGLTVLSSKNASGERVYRLKR